MRFLCSLALLLALSSSASAQILKEQAVESDSSRQVAEQPAAFFGPFRINGEKPAEFKNFDYFVLSYREQKDADKDDRDALVPDKQGVVQVRGQVATIKGALLDFETVKLVESGPVTQFFKGASLLRVKRAQPVALAFTTLEKKGVRYAFKGEYLDEPAEEGSGYTYLRGVLSKYRDGKLVAEEKLSFIRIRFEDLIAEAELREREITDPPPPADVPFDPPDHR
jgi:hypothetical protein